jgi:hypothetical protein
LLDWLEKNPGETEGLINRLLVIKRTRERKEGQRACKEKRGGIDNASRKAC